MMMNKTFLLKSNIKSAHSMLQNATAALLLQTPSRGYMPYY